MQVGQFPASAANSLIEGYCDDFVSLASVLAQTLEQVTMRDIDIRSSTASLERIETGMRDLSHAIRDLIERSKPASTRTAYASPAPAAPSSAPPKSAPPKTTSPASTSPASTSPASTSPASASGTSSAKTPNGGGGTHGHRPSSTQPKNDSAGQDLKQRNPPAQHPEFLGASELLSTSGLRPRTSAAASDAASDDDWAPLPNEDLLEDPSQKAAPNKQATQSQPANPKPNANAKRPPTPGEQTTSPKPRAPEAKPTNSKPASSLAHSLNFSGESRKSPQSTARPTTPAGQRPSNKVHSQQPKLGTPTQRQPTSSPPTAKPSNDRSTDDVPVSLKGSNDSMPLLSVFQFIERMRKDGVMTVKLADETMKFSFDRGCVQSCTTDKLDQNERLGDLLLKMGTCDPIRLNRLLKHYAGKSQVQVGERIIQAGLASPGQIMDVLETQVRQRFARARAARSASYEFVDCKPANTDGRIRIAPMELSFKPSRDPA